VVGFIDYDIHAYRVGAEFIQHSAQNHPIVAFSQSDIRAKKQIPNLSERSESFERFWHPITYLLFPLSGAVFMVEWLPAQAQKYILWLPMVHCTEMLRHGYWGNAVRTHEDPAYLALCSFILFFIGLALVRETGRRVEPE
jgi:hypothetical protein